MTADDTAAGQPGEPTDPFGFADDFGIIRDPTELSPEDEDYRRRAYAAVAHYAGDYSIPCFPIWWMASDGVCACKEGINCDRKGKHPIDFGWPEVATNDPEEAARWWRKLSPGDEIIDWRPRANIGLAMGEDHFLLDVDMGPGQQGDISLTALISHYDNEDLPHTLMYQTGGGGRQHVMLIPEGTEARNSVSELGDFLDIRGIRGYGIAPPSVSGKGEYVGVIDAAPSYPCTWLAKWLAEQQRKRTERIASRPEGSKTRLLPKDLTPRAHKYIDGALADAVGKVAEAPEHTRNNTLFAQAKALFTRFAVVGLLDPGDIATALKDAADICGLGCTEISRTLDSAWSASEDRSGDLPSFIFAEAVEVPVDGLVLPGIEKAFYAFERFYDLRRSAEGFYARPAEPGTPAVVIEIGADLGRKIMLWWRRAAEAWNAKGQEIRDEADEAWLARFEAMDEQQQFQVLKKMFLEKRAKKDSEEDEGKRAEVLARPDYITRILAHLEASATQFDLIELHLRVADGPGYTAVDLADESGDVVLVTGSGFKVCDVRSVPDVPWFKRNKPMKAQCLPVTPAGPDAVYEALESAQSVLDVDDEQWKVTLSGLIGAFFPSVDRPGWWITGPPGSGKTTRGRMIAGWVDPSNFLGGQLDLKRDERNARTRASNRFVVSMDNLNKVTQEESDFWCTLHTGASADSRKLHTDNEMLSFEYRRIGLATSLNLPAGLKPDALRRMLHITLTSTEESLDLGPLWAKYERTRPAVTGALYQVLAGVLEKLPDALAAKLAGLPEMADFARILYAADLAYPGLGGLFDAYKQHVIEVLVAAGLQDPVVMVLHRVLVKEKSLDDSPTELHGRLEAAAGLKLRMDKRWPQDAVRLGHRLNELGGTLQRMGIIVTPGRSSKSRNYKITRSANFDDQAVTGGDAQTVTFDSDGDDSGDDGET